MNRKTIQLWIILLFVVLCAQVNNVSAKKNSEEIIVINNTGGGGCGSGAKTIVKTDGSKKKKKGGHSIILMAGGGGKCGDKHHHHTKVVHVPYPVPVPVPVKHHHEEHQEKHDHWASSSNNHDDHWTSASSNDEIKPHHKSLKVSSASVPHRPYGVMMSRMEKQSGEPKSTILQTLLNGNEKANNRAEKKSSSKNLSSDSKKKTEKDNTKDQITPQLITHHHLVNPDQQNVAPPELMLPPPAAFGMLPPEAMQPPIGMMHPNYFSTMSNVPMPNEMQQQYAQQSQPQSAQEVPQPTLEQQQQLHDAIQQHIQMQQHFEHHLQKEHQKMQEAMASSLPQQLPNDSPLASQLPIPLPGQSLSAPVFEPIEPVNSNQTQQSNMMNSQQMQAQLNELEIIPYEVQLQAAQLRHFAQSAHESSLKEPHTRANSLMGNYGKDDGVLSKNKKYDLIEKDHPLEVSSSNAVLNAAISVLPPNHSAQQYSQQNHIQTNQLHHFNQPDMHPIFNTPFRSFMMMNENKNRPSFNANDLEQQQTIQIPIIIAAESAQEPQEERMTVKRFKI